MADHSTVWQWCELEKALPVEQREQLAGLILARLDAGWGEVVIEFKDHHILSFREINSIAARKKKVGVIFMESDPNTK